MAKRTAKKKRKPAKRKPAKRKPAKRKPAKRKPAKPRKRPFKRVPPKRPIIGRKPPKPPTWPIGRGEGMIPPRGQDFGDYHRVSIGQELDEDDMAGWAEVYGVPVSYIESLSEVFDLETVQMDRSELADYLEDMATLTGFDLSDLYDLYYGYGPSGES